jgi:hypothetical protein
MLDDGLGCQILDLRVREMDDPWVLSELCPNLKRLELNEWKCDYWFDSNNAAIANNWRNLQVIKEFCSKYSLTMTLLDAGFDMISLTYLTMDVYNLTEKRPKLFELLKHAPVLEHLILKRVSDLDYKKLDVLHENTRNLKHLELEKVNYDIVKEGDVFTYHYSPLPISSVANNLQSFTVTFYDFIALDDCGFYGDFWTEYICRKYTNLTSIVVPAMKTIVTTHYLLKEAFYNWTQLKKFDMQPYYISADILQVMDDCNICLDELKVHIENEADMKQFTHLAHSKQGKTIQKLVIKDTTEEWVDQEHLVYFLQSLNESDCRLKEIIIGANPKTDNSNADFNILSPIQILDYVPCLQKLSMDWIVTKDQANLTCKQTTHLTYLYLILHPFYKMSKLESSALQQIQNIVHKSPLLQSFSVRTLESEATLDFQQNTKLKYFKCFASIQAQLKITQNNQTKSYTFSASYGENRRYVLVQEPLKKNRQYHIILCLPSTLRSIFINHMKFSI